MVRLEIAHVADPDDRAVPPIQRAADLEAAIAQRLYDPARFATLRESERGDGG